MIVKWHKIGNQDIFSTPNIDIRLGDLVPEQTQELEVDHETANKLLQAHSKYTVEDGQIIDKQTHIKLKSK